MTTLINFNRAHRAFSPVHEPARPFRLVAGLSSARARVRGDLGAWLFLLGMLLAGIALRVFLFLPAR
jgi:hypothetical protein